MATGEMKSVATRRLGPLLRSVSTRTLLVERLAKQCLDDRLPADIETGRPLIEFWQRALRKIDIHAAKRFQP